MDLWGVYQGLFMDVMSIKSWWIQIIFMYKIILYGTTLCRQLTNQNSHKYLWIQCPFEFGTYQRLINDQIMNDCTKHLQ